MLTTATRYHDFSAGHRVAGHESKCAFLHGHNYRVHFTCAAELDRVGRVLDFSALKTILCDWLEENWDHRFLAWKDDSFMQILMGASAAHDDFQSDSHGTMRKSIVWVPFNPTAENMAQYLLREIGPAMLPSNVSLIKVVVDETRKCSASAELSKEEWAKT